MTGSSRNAQGHTVVSGKRVRHTHLNATSSKGRKPGKQASNMLTVPAWQLLGTLVLFSKISGVWFLSSFLKIESQSGAHAGLELGVLLPWPPWC